MAELSVAVPHAISVEELSTRNETVTENKKQKIKTSQLIKNYISSWISLAPDDMELAHRLVSLFCVLRT